MAAERDEDNAPDEDPAKPPDGDPAPDASSATSAKVKGHWYRRITPGARMLFWSIYFAIFVVAAVGSIVVALVQMAATASQVMRNPVTSLFILVSGTLGEMWCLHRNLNIYMLGKPGKEYARYGVYVSGGALTLSFLLAIAIVVLYLGQ